MFQPDALASIDVAEREARWRTRLEEGDPAYGIFVVEDGRIAGWIVVGTSESEDDPTVGEVFGIYVDPPHWGTGVGTLAMEYGLEWLRERGFAEAVLWVLADNPRARGFYEVRGWRADGGTVTREYLGTSVEIVRYRRSLEAGILAQP